MTFERDIAASRNEVEKELPSFLHDADAPGVLAESTFGETDDEDSNVVTPATQIRFIRRLTGCFPHPETWDNPLFDRVYLPWALRAGWENHILRHPKRGEALFAGVDAFMIRTDAVLHFSWAVPTLPVISSIASFVEGNGMVEIGAGSGYWSKLVSLLGADVTAVDSFAEAKGPDGKMKPLFFPVTEADGDEYIKSGRAGRKALFFCWPRGDFSASKGFPGYAGSKVIWVGEEDGCTANISSALTETGDWEIVSELYMPRWKCMNDVCHLLQRRNENLLQ